MKGEQLGVLGWGSVISRGWGCGSILESKNKIIALLYLLLMLLVVVDRYNKGWRRGDRESGENGVAGGYE